MNAIQWKVSTAVGDLFLVASAKGLNGIYWDEQNVPMASSLNGKGEEEAILATAVRQLEEYFRGERREFTLPFDITGTAFQKTVWAELQKIPFGATISYRELAQRIGNEGAVRAVGGANGRNPLCVVIPCHRVIAADGSLGGYSGGLDKKIALLAREGISL